MFFFFATGTHEWSQALVSESRPANGTDLGAPEGEAGEGSCSRPPANSATTRSEYGRSPKETSSFELDLRTENTKRRVEAD